MDGGANSNVISGDYIGTDRTGAVALPNDAAIVLNGVSNTTIGGTTGTSGNVIVNKSPTAAVRDLSSSGGESTIQGNYIGINAAGDAALGYSGIALSSNANHIGGAVAGAGNVIAGTADNLIAITGTNNVIEGNFIGWNAAGTQSLASSAGLNIAGSANIIGGTSIGSRNVIAVQVVVSGSSHVFVGNFIGLDPTGTVSLPQPASAGIELEHASSCVVGGSAPGMRNAVAGTLRVFECANVRVEGNYIGTNSSGTIGLGGGISVVSGSGIGSRFASGTALINNVIATGSSGTAVALSGALDTVIADNKIGVAADGVSPLQVGGRGIYITSTLVHPAPSYRTTIRHNIIAHTATGVFIDSGYNTQITANSIYANRGLGIDLAGYGAGEGVTPNDAGDADAGANNLQNFPVISSVTFKNGTVTVQGTLNSAPNGSYRLEFFGNDAVNASGHGEGQYYLGAANVVTDATGNVAFNQSFAVPSSARSISATATDTAGNTSEFSAGQGQLLNISTRAHVGLGDDAVIGGFIITGSETKRVLLRALGPSLGQGGVSNVLADPSIELFDSSGKSIAFDNDWKDNQQREIAATGVPPSDDKEAAILATLQPGAYTGVLRGSGDTIGNGLIEVYDLNQPASSRLANISTRAFVGTGDALLIGGFIVGPSGSGPAGLLLRALGPSLRGVATPLQDPVLELRDASGALLARNDDWKENQAAVDATGIPPSNGSESALVTALAPGNYTAIVRGKNDSTGTALMEVYNLQ